MSTAKKTPTKKPAAIVATAPPPQMDVTKGFIHAMLANIMDSIEAIGKDSQNKQQNFKYRGIDQAYNAIHPLLAINKVVTVPRVVGLISRMTVPTKSGGSLNYTMLSVEYDFLCNIDGSKVTVGPIYAEGMDSADKSTAKALASGHKYAIFQLFCIPTSDMPDGDAESHDVVMPQATLMPMNPAQQTPKLIPVQPPTTGTPPTQHQPATGSLMPQVPVNQTAVAQGVVAAANQMSPEEWDGTDNDTIVIEDEPSAVMAADMLINLANSHKDTLNSLQEFWHLNQAVLKVLHSNFSTQYQRVSEVFSGLKAQLQTTTEGK